ncbi:hypothetical protein AURDEDRAFT_111920 [Auricularia subglabra TFB-10046 SS5]|nr:hypothetical protein AURDEDRAFT_111920 [Auricularia subglabra TFB-10046 SS5]
MAWPGWPVQMPMAPQTLPFAMPGMPMHPQPAGGQQAFVAQFMAQVQHMNMLAQAMLPSFFPAAPPLPQPPLPPPPLPRARSVDSRSPEPEQRPRSRSALRKSTSSVERSTVRKRVSFLLQNDLSDDDETRGRVRYRGTPAPGRGDARSRTSSAPAR